MNSNIKDLEKTLWAAADKMRGGVSVTNYKFLILGLIFLKYISDSFDETTKRAGRNVQEVLLMTAAEVNVEQLLNARKVVIVESALETIANRTK